MFGKKITTTRKVAWVADQGLSYTYSGIKKNPQEWSAPLFGIKQKLESFCGHQFNSCLLNLYHHGDEGMGWHSDDEPELGRNPLIASVSFGEERVFKLRHRKDKGLRLDVPLPHGSLLVMGGAMQHYWQHSLSKSAKDLKPRINLTFRRIFAHGK